MITPVLIAKYLGGQCSKEEQEEVDNWRALATDNEATFNRIKTIWEETGKVRPMREVQETEAAWQKLKSKIKTTPKAAPKWKKLSFIIPRAAAAILIFTSMIIFYITQTNGGSEVVKMVEISTQKGEKRQLALADGSKVWLNAESTIKYAKDFSGETRDIYLEGEAYFDVAKNPQKPFKVHTKELETVVLGTQFNVQAYPEMGNIIVALDEGKVKFGDGKNNIILSPGYKATYNLASNALSQDKISSKHNLWRNNVLDFNNVTLSDAVLSIERWFGEKVVIDNPKLEGCLVTASFNEPKINDVLEIVTSILSLESELVNGTYHIKGESCL